MFCDNNSNNGVNNCIIDETKNCSNFSDYMNLNNQCDNKKQNSNCNSNFNFSGFLPIIIVIIIFILFFCNNKNEC